MYIFIFKACKEGWYGDNCSQQCVGHCRDNTNCNHVTGRCETGCAARWTGILCAKGVFLFLKKVHRRKKSVKFEDFLTNIDVAMQFAIR